jgi:RNA polymerase sigma-54 factor
LQEIAKTCNVPLERAETILRLVQQFEPAGVAARDIAECLLIQLKILNQSDPILEQIIRFHLDDVAKKNHTRIAKSLKLPLEQIEPLIEKISKLDPKPGRNYSSDETQQVIPDVIIDETEEGLKITINNESVPHIIISRSYREMLKQKDLDPKAKEFLTEKLRRAYELLRSLSRRQSTLRKVVNTLVEIQKEAITQDISYLKPLTFREVAEKIEVHESTVCRVVMNKYCQTPAGVIALKDFFPSKLKQADENGQSVSSEHIKALIHDYIAEEDKRRPLSDEDIVKLLREKNLTVARRTVAKYREELKILSSSYRRLR